MIKLDDNKKKWIVIFIIFIGIFLRFYKIGEKSLWFDEAFSIYLSEQNLKTIIKQEINNPPLYHFILHYWIKIAGKSERATRLISAIFGIITLIFIYRLGVILFDIKTATLSTLLFSICPFHIYYCQEARMYSLVVLMTTISCYYFIKFLQEKSRLNLFLYFFFSLLSIYSHYFAFAIIAAQNVFLIVYRNKYANKIAFWFMTQLLLIVCYLPWSYIVIHAIEKGKERFLSHLYLRIPYTIFVFNLGYSGIIIDYYAKKNLLKTIVHNLPLILITFSIVLFLFFISVKNFKKKKECRVFTFIWFFSPFAFSVLFYLITHIPLLAERYFIVSLPAYYLILSVGWNELSSYKIKASLLILICSLFGYSLMNYYFNPKFGKGDWSTIAHYVKEHAQPNDILVFYPDHIAIPFDYYYDGKLKEYKISSLDKLKKIDINNSKIIWLIISHAHLLDYKTILSKDFNIIKEKIFPKSNGIFLFLLKGKNSKQ